MIEEDEVNVLILSDRGISREFAAVPSLLAVSGLHHFLIREGLRTRVLGIDSHRLCEAARASDVGQ